MEIILISLAVLVGLFLGWLISHYVRKLIHTQNKQSAQNEAEKILNQASEDRRRILIDAKEEAIKIRTSIQTELRHRQNDIQKTEQRLVSREEQLEARSDKINIRENSVNAKDSKVNAIKEELENLKEGYLTKLESLADLSHNDAKSELIEQAKIDIQHEVAVLYKDTEEQAKEESSDKAKEIIASAIQRLASDVSSESTVSTVTLQSDDIKGRLIGREGRNIKALEKATGVDLIIDETPQAVTLSCFDPIRREIARLSLVKLISDGRINPARIEDVVSRVQDDLNEVIRKTGDRTLLDLHVRGMKPDIVKLLGQLKYRYSYGQNVLAHSIEVANLASVMASEIQANVLVSKTGGLLHDIGKALTHELDDPHAIVGADIASKHGLNHHICSTIKEHHDDVHTSIESFLVAAADAISASRPGARKDTIQNYIKRLESLEEIGAQFDGVEKCFAIQAGREMRVMVKPDIVDDVSASEMARGIVSKIEESLVYPGQVKVTVIRESRTSEYAK